MPTPAVLMTTLISSSQCRDQMLPLCPHRCQALLDTVGVPAAARSPLRSTGADGACAPVRPSGGSNAWPGGFHGPGSTDSFTKRLFSSSVEGSVLPAEAVEPVPAGAVPSLSGHSRTDQRDTCRNMWGCRVLSVFDRKNKSWQGIYTASYRRTLPLSSLCLSCRLAVLCLIWSISSPGMELANFNCQAPLSHLVNNISVWRETWPWAIKGRLWQQLPRCLVPPTDTEHRGLVTQLQTRLEQSVQLHGARSAQIHWLPPEHNSSTLLFAFFFPLLTVIWRRVTEQKCNPFFSVLDIRIIWAHHLLFLFI